MLFILISFLILTVSKPCEISFKNFTCYLKDIRLSGFYHHVVVADKLLCANSCYIDDGCFGLAYHNSTQMCYLYDKFPSGQSSILDTGIVTYLPQATITAISYPQNNSIPQNIAFNRPTRMSSVYDNKYSSRAVDGDLTTIIHTRESPQEWWCVDLLKIYNFNSVVVYNRDNGWQYSIDRLKGFELRFSDDGECNLETLNGTRLCHKDTEPNALYIYNITSCDQQAVSFSSRFIFIKPRTNLLINIREVVVTSTDPLC